MEVLKVEGLSFIYPLCQKAAVKDISFSVKQGEFVVLCGATGSGKSTLLRLMKPEIAPLGEKSGTIFYKEVSINQLSMQRKAASIGFVMQNPEHQIVTDKVWHELAFGLENMGIPGNTMAHRIAEIASYFGIEHWYDKSVSELSGGQKQLLNLASVMVMNPDILILDEPTAQLDPIAASDFIATLKKINQDFSLTVIIVEHRLEELVPICDKLIVLEQGRLLEYGSPREVLARLQEQKNLILTMPTAVRLYYALEEQRRKKEKSSISPKKYRNKSCACPLTVKEGRQYIEDSYLNHITALPEQEYIHNKEVALEFQDVYFRYERQLPDVLCGLNLKVYDNEIFCILGGNGSGKTTSLQVAAGLQKAYSGVVRVFGKKIKDYRNQSLYTQCLSMLPQDVGTVFLKNTVKEELQDMGLNVDEMMSILPFDIRHLYEKHPYDLSGGEQQLVALAKVLATKPKLLLLDEPTKGLDAEKKGEIITILQHLKASGVTVIIVTHDVEFTAQCGDRCALFFRGKLVSVSTPTEFFTENQFYTTAASRMSRGYYEKTVTVQQVVELCRINGETGNENEWS